jgi:hypothetical protein
MKTMSQLLITLDEKAEQLLSKLAETTGLDNSAVISNLIHKQAASDWSPEFIAALNEVTDKDFPSLDEIRSTMLLSSPKTEILISA